MNGEAGHLPITRTSELSGLDVPGCASFVLPFRREYIHISYIRTLGASFPLGDISRLSAIKMPIRFSSRQECLIPQRRPQRMPLPVRITLSLLKAGNFTRLTRYSPYNPQPSMIAPGTQEVLSRTSIQQTIFHFNHLVPPFNILMHRVHLWRPIQNGTKYLPTARPMTSKNLVVTSSKCAVQCTRVSVCTPFVPSTPSSPASFIFAATELSVSTIWTTSY